MLISRRSFLLAAAATAGACSSRRRLGGAAAVDNPVSPIQAGGAAGPPNPDPKKVPTSVTMVGDSISALSTVALDAVLKGMGFAAVSIDAEPSRRIQVGRRNPTNGLDVVKFLAGATPPQLWVIELGTNDAGLYATDDEYRVLIASVLGVVRADVPLVWVNTYRGDLLAGSVQFNNVLRTTLADRGNATIADWYGQCVASGKSILTRDRVHPNENGILIFADTVRGAIATRLS